MLAVPIEFFCPLGREVPLNPYLNEGIIIDLLRKEMEASRVTSDA